VKQSITDFKSVLQNYNESDLGKQLGEQQILNLQTSYDSITCIRFKGYNLSRAAPPLSATKLRIVFDCLAIFVKKRNHRKLKLNRNLILYFYSFI